MVDVSCMITEAWLDVEGLSFSVKAQSKSTAAQSRLCVLLPARKKYSCVPARPLHCFSTIPMDRHFLNHFLIKVSRSRIIFCWRLQLKYAIKLQGGVRTGLAAMTSCQSQGKSTANAWKRKEKT